MKNKIGILLGTLLALGAAGGAQASSDVGMELMDPDISPHDRESIKRGAELYADYCVGCHSLQYLRYQRLARDVGEDEAWIRENIMHGDHDMVDPIMSPMDPKDGERWFGLKPPDLSLTTGVHGADWVYTYLNTFYRDEDAELGYNNLVQEGTSMPHVLFRLQPDQKAVRDDEGHIEELKTVEGAEAQLTQEEYRELTADITAFLSYAEEPFRADRERLGVWVILFLILLTGILYLVYKEYWRDLKKK